MYSYADRVEPSDRWAIAAYIRAFPGESDTEMPRLPEQCGRN